MTSESNQSTQYNQIASTYASIYPLDGKSTFPTAPIEEYQLYRALHRPDVAIRGKRVLDLACGSGYYTARYLEWGAQSVTGIDISQSMLDVACAIATQRQIPESKLKYMLGDVTDPNLKAEGEFDIVCSSWLLNYAPDTPTMTKMWDTVARHLKVGGVFVGLTVMPLSSARLGREAIQFEAKIFDSLMLPDGAWGKYGNRGQVLEVVEEGLKVKMELGFKEQGQEPAVFDCYYLGHESFETSAKAATVDGVQAFDGLDWQDFVIPEEEKATKPVGYWNECSVWPFCRACIARRTVGKPDKDI